MFIETKSGKTRCQINADRSRLRVGVHQRAGGQRRARQRSRLTAGGQVEWIVGNLGDIPVETIDYRTYSAEGWTIVAAEDGTRFTNDGTRTACSSVPVGSRSSDASASTRGGP